MTLWMIWSGFGSGDTHPAHMLYRFIPDAMQRSLINRAVDYLWIICGLHA